MFLRQARAPRLPVRSGRLFKVGREGIQGKGTAVLSAREGEIPDTSKLSHVARRRIAQPPMAKIEKAVTAVGEALQAWADRFIDAVMARTVPGLLRSDDQAELIEDATVDQVYASLSEPPDVAKATLESVFSAVDKASSDDLRVVGVRTGSVVSNAERLQAEWIRESTDLIKASQDVRRRVERILADPLTSGRSVDDIRKLLEEQAGYARSRAELTARDQTLKLYGRIQQERQTSAGFTHYVWTTSLDERVREGHAELEGTIQAWDDPPIVDPRTGRRGNPGADFQCRCSAVPYTGDDVGVEAGAGGEDDFELTATLPVDPRVEAEARAAARVEAQRLEAQRLEAQRLEAQRLERAERDRLEAERQARNARQAPPAPAASKSLTQLVERRVEVGPDVPEPQRRAVEAAFQQADLPGVKALEVTQRISSSTSNGDYSPATGEVRIAASRIVSRQVLPETPAPGQVWSISSTATTLDEAVRLTTLHELGHHAHMWGIGRFDPQLAGAPAASVAHRAAAIKVDQIVEGLWKSPNREYLTDYAGVAKSTPEDYRSSEYFAEAHAAYHAYPDWLRRVAPKAYRAVEDVIRIRRSVR